jgi:hypothetical protein
MWPIRNSIAFMLLMLLAACQPPPPGERVEEIRTSAGAVAELIRNPISAGKPADTTDAPVLRFDETTVDFGDIADDQIVTATFAFTNAGVRPLIISSARGSCGCTASDWPKDPVPPGGRNELVVRFDPTGKEGPQVKPLTITANTYPNTTSLTILANVKPKK